MTSLTVSTKNWQTIEGKIFNMSEERMYYAGVDMTDWDFSDIDDPDIIKKAFVAVCNFAEELSGCAGCPLRDKICFAKNGDKFWNNVLNRTRPDSCNDTSLPF